VVSYLQFHCPVTTTFSNAIHYQFDTDGNAIDLTSAKIDHLGGAYVWMDFHLAVGKLSVELLPTPHQTYRPGTLMAFSLIPVPQQFKLSARHPFRETVAALTSFTASRTITTFYG
jgi:hypothetical protein